MKRMSIKNWKIKYKKFYHYTEFFAVGTYGFAGEFGKKDYGCDNSADYVRRHGRGLLPLCKNCKEKEEK